MILQALTTWPVVRLADVLTLIENGSRPSGGVDQFRTGVPSLGGEHLDNDGGFNFSNIKYVPIEFFENMSKGIIQTSDILVVKDGATTGKVSLVADDFPYSTAAINEHLFMLRLNPQVVLSEFAFFFLFSAWGQAQIRRSFQGAAIGGINQDFINRVEIPLPPLPEQQRISIILRHAADLRIQRLEADELTQKLLPALFYKMFGDLHSEKRVPMRPLQDIAEVVSGVAKGRRLPDSVSVPYLRVANVQAGYLDLSEIKTIMASPTEVKELELRKGDVLLTEGGDFDKLGRGAMLEIDLPHTIHQNHVFRVRVDQEYLNPVFFANYLQTPFARAYFLRAAKKTTNLASINLTQLKNLPVPLPSLELQDAFDERLATVRQTESEQTDSRQLFDNLFQGLLARAFTGELTKGWRNQHEAELSVPTQQRDDWLKAQGVQRSVPTPTTVKQPVIIDNVLVARLSSIQQRVYDLAQNHPNPYFTLQTLWEEQEDEAPLDRDVIERGLSMLEALGVILKVSVPVSPTGEAFYQNVYRLAATQPIGEELRGLKDRFPNIRL